MTIETLFAVVVPLYLALVAYGQVASRRRLLGPRTRIVAGALRVVLPPGALLGALASTGDARLLASWGLVAAAMAVAGAIVAGLVELIAPRVGA